jgi:hypothetical protein
MKLVQAQAGSVQMTEAIVESELGRSGRELL